MPAAIRVAEAIGSSDAAAARQLVTTGINSTLAAKVAKISVDGGQNAEVGQSTDRPRPEGPIMNVGPCPLFPLGSDEPSLRYTSLPHDASPITAWPPNNVRRPVLVRNKVDRDQEENRALELRLAAGRCGEVMTLLQRLALDASPQGAVDVQHGAVRQRTEADSHRALVASNNFPPRAFAPTYPTPRAGPLNTDSYGHTSSRAPSPSGIRGLVAKRTDSTSTVVFMV